MQRYSVINEKEKREIALLRGRGCAYKDCVFCDYHLDYCADDEQNFALNKSVLDNVSGVYGDLEVINSGSVFELDDKTIGYIKKVCRDKGIRTIHFEAHYMYRDLIPALRESFKDFELKMKLGLESSDYDFREKVLKKGIDERDLAKIAEGFNEANFLFGITGQTVDMMRRDIETGLEHFERICVNLMCDNTTNIRPDKDAINAFIRDIYPVYRDDYRVDILINNTDFGVGS